MDIGKNIAGYRKTKNMTQDELGKALGVTNQAVSKWESGVSMPDIALLPLIADALDITLDAIYGIQPPKTVKSKICPDDFPDAVYDALHRIFYDADGIKYTCTGTSDEEQMIYRKKEMCDGAFMGCMSNTHGSVIMTDSLSFIDRTYKVPESEQIFLSRKIAGVLQKLSDKNLRRVLEYQYKSAFEKSKADNSSFTASEIETACNLSEEDAEKALELLCSLGLNESSQVDAHETVYTFLMSNGVFALAIFKLAEMMIKDKVWLVVRDTSFISDYAFNN